MSDTLKPCPFCGGEIGVGYSQEHNFHWWYCINCDARTGKYFKSGADAIADANRRYPNKNNDALMAECRDIIKDMGNAEWATPEHGAEILYELIDQHYSRLKALLGDYDLRAQQPDPYNTQIEPLTPTGTIRARFIKADAPTVNMPACDAPNPLEAIAAEMARCCGAIVSDCKSLKTGICICGAEMSSSHDNHCPVDTGDYYFDSMIQQAQKTIDDYNTWKESQK